MNKYLARLKNNSDTLQGRTDKTDKTQKTKLKTLRVVTDKTDRFPPMKFEVLKTQITRALRLRGDSEEEIQEVIDDCGSYYEESSWPGLFDYFEGIEQDLIPPKGAKCKNCLNWTKDPIGDGTGLGKCSAQSQILPWPNNICNRWNGGHQ